MSISLKANLNKGEKLDLQKATGKATDTQVKIIKGNKYLALFYIFHNFNNALSNCSFSHALEHTNTLLIFEKGAFKYHGTQIYKDDFCAINAGNEFWNLVMHIYLKELELNAEHQGTSWYLFLPK